MGKGVGERDCLPHQNATALQAEMALLLLLMLSP
jgi:hypothetical protein